MFSSYEIAARVGEIVRQMNENASAGFGLLGSVALFSQDSTRKIVYDIYPTGDGRFVARWRYFEGEDKVDEHFEVCSHRTAALTYLSDDHFNEPIRKHRL